MIKLIKKFPRRSVTYPATPGTAVNDPLHLIVIRKSGLRFEVLACVCPIGKLYITCFYCRPSFAVVGITIVYLKIDPITCVNITMGIVDLEF